MEQEAAKEPRRRFRGRVRPPTGSRQLPSLALAASFVAGAGGGAAAVEPEEEGRETIARFERNASSWKPAMESLVRLARIGPAAVPALTGSLERGTPPVRILAAKALGPLADPRARSALLRALEDPIPAVRIHAIEALSLLGRIDAAEEPYRRLLEEDHDPWVRIHLSWALERDRPAEDAKAILEDLRSHDPAFIDSARLDGPAPDFRLRSAGGSVHALSDYRGKHDLVLVFYEEEL